MNPSRRDVVLAGLGVSISACLPNRSADADEWRNFPAAGDASGRAVTIWDDLGVRLDVTTPMQRVAVFNRYTAEFIRALAGSKAIVGIDAGAARDPTYWPGLRAERIGEGQSHPNYEAIVALRPDAVFFPRNSEWAKARQVLTPFSIPVIVLTCWDVLKHEANVALLGRLLEQPGRAAKLNAFYRHFADLLAERTAGLARKRVYFEEVGDYKTVLKGSGWHDMIEAAGGTNIFGDLSPLDRPAARGNTQAFDIDPEEIFARRPEIIVKLQPNQYAPHAKTFSVDVLMAIASRPGLAGSPAVASGEVFHVSYFLASACSKIVGALQIAKWLHPERFADVDPGEAMRTWLEEFQSVPYPGGYWVSLSQIRS
jgi:iron complex transport system substrate-binding protein